MRHQVIPPINERSLTPAVHYYVIHTLRRASSAPGMKKKGWTSSVIPLHRVAVALVTNRGFVLAGRQWLLDFRALENVPWLNVKSRSTLCHCGILSRRPGPYGCLCVPHCTNGNNGRRGKRRSPDDHRDAAFAPLCARKSHCCCTRRLANGVGGIIVGRINFGVHGKKWQCL